MLCLPFPNDALQPLRPKLASRCIGKPGGRRLRTRCSAHTAASDRSVRANARHLTAALVSSVGHAQPLSAS